MANYDFLTLNSDDFEKLTRDLLQEELSVTLESYQHLDTDRIMGKT